MLVNVAMADSAAEYSVNIPRGLDSLHLRCREALDLLVAEVPGATLTAPFYTVPSGTVLSVFGAENIAAGGWTLYLRCPGGAATAELLAW